MRAARLVTLLVWPLMLALSAPSAVAEFNDSGRAWIEAAPGSPPRWDRERLIPIETPRGSALNFGVDPATITVGDDGVVRFVAVASSAQGATTALFEGIRCSNYEFRIYAMQNAGEAWSSREDSPWQSLSETSSWSGHPLAIARAGVCTGRAPNGPVDVIVRSLRAARRIR